MPNFFGSQTLEVAIGLTLFFLLISLLCTAAREVLESFMKTRAVDLERGLRELLNDPDGRGAMLDLMNHPMVFSLFTRKYDPGALKPVLSAWGQLRAVLRAIPGLRGPLKDWLTANRPSDGVIEMRMRAMKGRNLPSYIPANQFAHALIDLVARGPSANTPYGGAIRPAIEATAPLTTASLRQAAAVFPNTQISRAVISGLDAAGDDLDKVRSHLEAWFNGSMDRVSGWSKRRTQTVLFYLGLIIAVFLNLDSLTVLDRLNNDPALRASAVAAAEQRIKAAPPTDPDAQKAYEKLRQELSAVGYPMGWTSTLSGAWGEPIRGQLTPLAQSAACVDISGKATPSIGQIAKSDPACKRALLPATDKRCVAGKPRKDGRLFGADPRCPGSKQPYFVSTRPWILSLLGWVITALAVTLGSPFWFDVLNRFMIIRSTVKPAEKSPNEPSIDPAKAKMAAAESASTSAQQPAQGATVAPPASGGVAPVAESEFIPHVWTDPTIKEGVI